MAYQVEVFVQGKPIDVRQMGGPLLEEISLLSPKNPAFQIACNDQAYQHFHASGIVQSGIFSSSISSNGGRYFVAVQPSSLPSHVFQVALNSEMGASLPLTLTHEVKMFYSTTWLTSWNLMPLIPAIVGLPGAGSSQNQPTSTQPGSRIVGFKNIKVPKMGPSVISKPVHCRKCGNFNEYAVTDGGSDGLFTCYGCRI